MKTIVTLTTLLEQLGYTKRAIPLWELTIKNIVSNMAGGASTALSFNNSAGLGLSSGTSLGIGVASLLFSGPGMMGRDSAFAFVSESEASSPSDATQVIRHHFLEAVQIAAKNNGYAPEILDETMDLRLSSKRNFMVIGLSNEEIGCLTEAEANDVNEVCTAALYYPAEGSSLRQTPIAAQNTAGNNSYQFHARDNTKNATSCSKPF